MKLSAESILNRSRFKLVAEAAKSNGYRKSDIMKSGIVLLINHEGGQTVMVFKDVNEFKAMSAVMVDGVYKGADMEFTLVAKASFIGGEARGTFWKSFQRLSECHLEYTIIDDKDWKF